MEKERYLNQLLDVIRVLRGPESDVARKHLKAYESNHTRNRMKMFRLYKYIKINDIQDYDKLKKRVSPDSTDDSFNKLIRRTTERVQESLIIDVNIRRKGAYNDVFRMKFFIRKQLIQGQILMGRGLKERPLHLFNNSIRYAKKYELYDEILEALHFKQVISSNIIGYKNFDKIGIQLEFYENCRSLLRESRLIREEFNAKNFNKSKKLNISKLFEEKVEEIRTYYNSTNSANILSNYYLLKMDIERAREKYFRVSKLSRAFIVLMKSSPAIYSNVRVSYLYNELASIEFILLNFEVALKEIDDSSKYLINTSLMTIMLAKTKLSVLLLLGTYKVAKETLKEINKLPLISKHPFHESIFSYQEAIAHFGLKEYKEAQSILSQKTEIEKDKEGWNVWVRIMRILCSIELLKLNMIDYDVESFRKYIQRINKQYEVRERDKLVLKVLLELDKQNYDFEATAVEASKELEKLKSTDKKYAWNPDSPELILFHDWFEAKRLKKGYEPNFEVYREAMKKLETK